MLKNRSPNKGICAWGVEGRKIKYSHLSIQSTLYYRILFIVKEY